MADDHLLHLPQVLAPHHEGVLPAALEVGRALRQSLLAARALLAAQDHAHVRVRARPGLVRRVNGHLGSFSGVQISSGGGPEG
eukprot:9094649-Pyramimonas_sp.AAC.1